MKDPTIERHIKNMNNSRYGDNAPKIAKRIDRIVMGLQDDRRYTVEKIKV